MIHQVRLNDVPGDFVVPDDLQQRFWYDAQKKQLCFDGFMSKATFDRLERLSQERRYQDALEDLFRICVPETRRPRTAESQPRAFAAAMLSLALLGGLGVLLLLVR